MHNRKRNRLHGFDYSRDALYFVTSCVRNGVCCFGEIKNGMMQLKESGKIAERQWHWLAEQYPYVILHAFVVMPNHIHGIIEINRNFSEGKKIKSISELMGAYKTTSSKEIHKTGLKEFAWQRSFHDHIIRDERAHNNIENYIFNNPLNWKKDTFHK